MWIFYFLVIKKKKKNNICLWKLFIILLKNCTMFSIKKISVVKSK